MMSLTIPHTLKIFDTVYTSEVLIHHTNKEEICTIHNTHSPTRSLQPIAYSATHHASDWQQKGTSFELLLGVIILCQNQQKIHTI